jgi:hypothetical protein
MQDCLGNKSANQQKERGQRGSLEDQNGLGDLKIVARHDNLHRWQGPKATSEGALNATDVVAIVVRA